MLKKLIWKLFHRTKYYFVIGVRRYIPDEFEWQSMVNRWKVYEVWNNGNSQNREDCILEKTRCWGFYKSKKLAIKAVEENWTDMSENGYYQYVIIEEFHEGLLDVCHKDKQIWFVWLSTDGYKLIEKPNWSCINYGIC